jgi:hypothetical protein
MSRSYHVTKRAAIRAFSEGDNAPTLDASEKSDIKKTEKRERRAAVAGLRRRKNSAIVAGEKDLTKRVLRGRADKGSFTT